MIRFLLRGLLIVWLGHPLVSVAQVAELQPQDVVATRGGVALTVGMVDEKVASMPEEIRSGYFDEPDRMARLIDSMLLTAQLAANAEEAGLSSEVPVDVTGLDRMTALANTVLRRRGVLESDEDYLMLAKERYQARKKDYASLEAFVLQYLFIDATSRGQVAAKLIADAARQRAAQGEDFAALIEEYSDIKDTHPLNGTIDYAEAIRLAAPLQAALSAFQRKPGISDVIEDGTGYHILRLVEYLPPVVPSFDEIKDQIVAQLKEESMVGAKTTFMREFSLQDVQLNDSVIQRLPDRYYRAGDESGVRIITP